MSDTMEITTSSPPVSASIPSAEGSHVAEGKVMSEGKTDNVFPQQMEGGQDNTSFADGIFKVAKDDGVDSALESLANDNDVGDGEKISKTVKEDAFRPRMEFANDPKPLTIEDIDRMILELSSKIERAIEKGNMPSLDLLLALSSIENMSAVLKKLLEKKKDEEDEASSNVVLGLFNILSSILRIMMEEDKYLPKDRNQEKPEIKVLPILPSSKLA